MRSRDEKANAAYRSMVQTQLFINKKPGHSTASVGVQQVNPNQSTSQYKHQVDQVLRNNKLR